MSRNRPTAASHGHDSDVRPRSETSRGEFTRRAFHDAEYLERHLERPPGQLVVAADDRSYAWDVGLAFLAGYELRPATGCCVVSTDYSADRVARDFDRLLADSRLGVVQVDVEDAADSDPYAATPVHSLPTVRDYTSLFLTVDDVIARFDGDSTLVVHSLEELLAETSVRAVSRLLALCRRQLETTPQVFTLDVDRCSSASLEAIRSTVDTLVRIDDSGDGRRVTVDQRE
ncbi:hypothetical protein [Halocalculus aciditolerans]|uniref:Uncharacterized protein n=1 Tax=Halocalculus aciditolerans TaxID=1383812 RepID=A0A830F9T4_9EURY|nr:hypothetical protein [Halocalculus aciditolerans]GGL68472.1 hypothetical protein GCM10009039_28120 [Halocalculus aciditolerans]